MENSVKYRNRLAVIQESYENLLKGLKMFKMRVDNVDSINSLGTELTYNSFDYLSKGYGKVYPESLDEMKENEIPSYISDTIIDIDHLESYFLETKANLLRYKGKEGVSDLIGNINSLIFDYNSYISILKKFISEIESEEEFL